jgi:hypothetical protein
MPDIFFEIFFYRLFFNKLIIRSQIIFNFQFLWKYALCW